ncbi:MAG: helix-turn-helix domain-containing protein [Acidobacteria bacterium]|nr:helix-turn-helix domain-containing protein [Acidobacteriota bacterium]
MPGVKAYKFKLKTNPAFEQACVFTLDTCRELYNASLQERRDAYQINHVSINYNSQSAQLPGIKPSARTLPPSTVRCFKTFCADLKRRSTTSFAASRQVKNRATQDSRARRPLIRLSILRAVSVSKATNCT